MYLRTESHSLYKPLYLGILGSRFRKEVDELDGA
jgi:hypothetical protein